MRARSAWRVTRPHGLAGRAIAGSRYPGLRAAVAWVDRSLYLLLFASTYFLMERASAANFTQPLTRTTLCTSA